MRKKLNEGNQMFEKLSLLLSEIRTQQEAFMSVTQAEDHLASPMVEFGGKY